MQHYELLYIIPNKYPDEEIQTINKTINKIIEDLGGKVSLNDNLGKFKLAYSIKQTTQGSYLLVEFDIEQKTLKDLDHKLRLTPEILRHQIVVKTQREKEAAEKMKVRKETEKKFKAEKKPVALKKEKKISLQELDQKLDEILSSKIE